jgi:cytoskeletal protein RodZ
MNLAEIQSFKQIGRHLRSARETRGLTLSAAARICGLKIFEVVRIENGELLGYQQVQENTLSNAQIYAKALDIKLRGFKHEVQHGLKIV